MRNRALFTLILVMAFSPDPSALDAEETVAKASGHMSGRSNSAGPLQVDGIFPHLTMEAGAKIRSEVGIGALVAWANKLWAVTYTSHGKSRGETGLGLFEISPDMSMRRHPKAVTGTYANRMIHWPSNQAIVGPHIIDEEGNVRTFEDLTGPRLAATMSHLESPENKVYFLGMGGGFYEADVETLKTKKLASLREVLPGVGHFKAAYTAHGRVVVADNRTVQAGAKWGRAQAPPKAGKVGILAEWDGDEWTVIDRRPYVEVSGLPSYGSAIFALGFDRASVILKVFARGDWDTYRLPKASHTYDHDSNTEWYRIRQVQSKRFLMDAHGMFYELPAFTYYDSVWGIRPISTHLRVVPDFVSWRGMLVLAADMQEANVGRQDSRLGQRQSNLWFGKTDDLWKWGKPRGWGGPWLEKSVKADQPSNPYLMTGFDDKVLHLRHQSDQPVTFTVEVDFVGRGNFSTYKQIEVPANGYVHHEFPDAFSAHWVRFRADRDCMATTWLTYK